MESGVVAFSAVVAGVVRIGVRGAEK